MICQMILFLRRSRVWSLEIGCWQGHGEEVRVQSTVGRSISDAADDDHSSEDRWKDYLDTSSALQEGDTHPGQLGVSGRKTGYKGGGKPPGPLVSIRWRNQLSHRYSSDGWECAVRPLVPVDPEWDDRSALGQSKSHPVPAWGFQPTTGGSLWTQPLT